MDFYLKKYEELLSAVSSKKIPVYTVADWLLEKPSYGIMLRHDIDRYPLFAKPIAYLEKNYNVKSTFYIRMVKSVFREDVINVILNNGHELGYHYEVLSKSGGNYKEAINLFKSQLTKLREYTEIRTIAMHGSAASSINNLDLRAQHIVIKDEVISSLQEVMDNTAFASGPFVQKFEEEFAEFCDTEY